MNAMRRAALVVCLVLLGVGASAKVAQAAPVLVLGVQTDDREDQKLGAVLLDHVERSGEKVLKRARLVPSERRCNEQPCL